MGAPLPRARGGLRSGRGDRPPHRGPQRIALALAERYPADVRVAVSEPDPAGGRVRARRCSRDVVDSQVRRRQDGVELLPVLRRGCGCRLHRSIDVGPRAPRSFCRMADPTRCRAGGGADEPVRSSAGDHGRRCQVPPEPVRRRRSVTGAGGVGRDVHGHRAVRLDRRTDHGAVRVRTSRRCRSAAAQARSAAASPPRSVAAPPIHERARLRTRLENDRHRTDRTRQDHAIDDRLPVDGRPRQRQLAPSLADRRSVRRCRSRRRARTAARVHRTIRSHATGEGRRATSRPTAARRSRRSRVAGGTGAQGRLRAWRRVRDRPARYAPLVQRRGARPVRLTGRHPRCSAFE